MKDTKTKERFVELRAEGWSYSRIAAELKTSKQTLIVWSKEFNFEISNLKQIELESLQEKMKLQKEHQLQFFGEQLGRLKEEIAKRNLTYVPTSKLIELYLKMNSAMAEEMVQPQFREEKQPKIFDLDNKVVDIWTA